MPYPDVINYHNQQISSKISLKPKFKQERLAMRILGPDNMQQKYLHGEKQKAHRISFSESEGTFITEDGRFLSNRYNFIVTCEENPQIICHKTFNHSHLANGKKVLAAGELIFRFHELKEITNNSGHYQPQDNEMLAFIKALYVASRGTLSTYTSHCIAIHQSYPVTELITAADFSEVKALDEGEYISEEGCRKESSGYEIVIENPNYQSFHRNLNKDLAKEYQRIIDENRNGFFSTQKGDTQSSNKLRKSSASHSPLDDTTNTL
jgi:hypothetical protein